MLNLTTGKYSITSILRLHRSKQHLQLQQQEQQQHRQKQQQLWIELFRM